MKKSIEPEDFKKELIKNLRSGEYTQIKGAYRRRVSDKLCHCAVGVAIDTLAQLKNVDYLDIWEDLIGYMGLVGLENEIRKKIIDLNDIKALDFNQIADWIEENL